MLNKNKHSQAMLVIGGFVALTIMLVVGWVILRPRQPLIPSKIATQLNFKPIVPQNVAGDFVFDKQSVKYSPDIKLLSYVIRSKNNSVTVSEEAYPDNLIFSSLTGAMNVYDKLNTEIGSVSLTLPSNLHGKQSAVTNAHSLLLFANPQNGALTKQQWQQLFDNLSVTK